MSRRKLITVVVKNSDPKLRRFLTLFLTEIAPLTFVGAVSARMREKIWDVLNTEYQTAEATMVYSFYGNENRFQVMENSKAKEHNTTVFDGLVISQRRSYERPEWMKILGKSQPYDYPLIYHMADTMAVTKAIWDLFLSEKQKRTIKAGVVNMPEETIFKLIQYIAGLHDIGKASPYWQAHTLKRNYLDSNDENSLKTLSCSNDSLLWRHELNGAVFIQKDILPSSSLAESIKQIIAGHHGVFHSLKLMEYEYLYEIDYSTYTEILDKWEDHQQSINQELKRLVDIDPQENWKIKPSAIPLITGLVILADWIASTENFIQEAEITDSLENHYENSYSRGVDFLEKEHLLKPKWNPNLSWQDMFPKISVPNPLQQNLIDNISVLKKKRGLTLITAPMGIGKTEASLYLASQLGQEIQNSGVWFALPTKTTTDAMFMRGLEIVEKIYQDPTNSVALMHSDSLITETTKQLQHSRNQTKNRHPEEVQSFDGDNTHSSIISDYLLEKKMGGFSNFSVSTIDQLLPLSVKLKHNALRWLAFTGKVLVFDEIHDFDVYTFGLICTTVAWAGYYDVPVICMSATLTSEQQKALIKYYLTGKNANPDDDRDILTLVEKIVKDGLPSPSWVNVSIDENGITDYIKSDFIPYTTYSPSNSLSLTPSDNPLMAMAEQAVEHYFAGGMVLIVCNTVNNAITVAKTLVEKNIPEHNIDVLHSRIPSYLKQPLIQKILKYSGKTVSKRSPRILVTTQVVQQSVDIDFDVLITELSPLSEILQRAGRIARHDNPHRAVHYKNNPTISICYDPQKTSPTLNPNIQSIVYPTFHVLATLEILLEIEDKSDWNPKHTIQQLFQKYQKKLNSLSNQEPYKKYKNELEGKNANKDAQKEWVSIPEPKNSNTVLPHLTSTMTLKRKSEETAVRLIDPTKQVLFTRTSLEKKFFVKPTGEAIPLDPENYFDVLEKASLYGVQMRTDTLARKKIFEHPAVQNFNFLPILKNNDILYIDYDVYMQDPERKLQFDEKYGLR